MYTRLGATFFLCLFALTTQAQIFRAEASTETTTCAMLAMNANGGAGTVQAQSDTYDRLTCDDESIAGTVAYSDLATGYAFAAGNAVRTSRATGEAQYTDLLSITATTDVVTVRATLDLIANVEGALPDEREFLFARITLGAAGEIELRQCNSTLCPDAPIANATLGGEFTLQRSPGSGNFPPIGVAATAIIDVRNAGGFLAARTRVEVIDDSGASISSASGVYGKSALIDSDADGAPDGIDRCDLNADPDQRDTNNDGLGNVCDPDLNNDMMVNAIDLGLMRERFFSNDPDADLNGDGTVNVIDLGILRLFFGGAPGL